MLSHQTESQAIGKILNDDDDDGDDDDDYLLVSTFLMPRALYIFI